MWKYVVLWLLGTMIIDPCPDIDSKDEFGRGSSIISCNVLHYHYEYTSQAKAFHNRDSALIFYNKALEESKRSSYGMDIITSIEFDSISDGSIPLEYFKDAIIKRKQ